MADEPIRWTIGILTIPPRVEQLRNLLDVLEPQVQSFDGEIQLIVLYNNFEKTIGELRQKIVEQARGEYISFIDDDDMVPNDFCKTIMPALDGKVDYVGFKVAFFDNDLRMRPVRHSLEYKDWFEDEKGYYRDISHLNPVKRELALQATFRGGMGEDRDWASQLRGKLKKQNFIDREMYEYRHSSEGSRSHGARPGDLGRININEEIS